MSEHILPLGLAFLLVGALFSGCKGAEADLFPLDAGPGSSGGGGTPTSLTQGASSSGGGASGSSSSGSGIDSGDDGSVVTDGGTDAQDDRAAQGDAPVEAATPVADAAVAEDADDAGSQPVAEGGDDAPSSSDDAAVAPDAGTDGLVCTNLGCIDFFDCAIFHPAEVGPCGFTKCVNLVCQ